MKALLGDWEHRPDRLLAENAVLRGRVAELSAALQRAQEEIEVLRRMRDAAIEEAARHEPGVGRLERIDLDVPAGDMAVTTG